MSRQPQPAPAASKLYPWMVEFIRVNRKFVIDADDAPEDEWKSEVWAYTVGHGMLTFESVDSAQWPTTPHDVLALAMKAASGGVKSAVSTEQFFNDTGIFPEGFWDRRRGVHGKDLDLLTAIHSLVDDNTMIRCGTLVYEPDRTFSEEDFEDESGAPQ